MSSTMISRFGDRALRFSLPEGESGARRRLLDALRALSPHVTDIVLADLKRAGLKLTPQRIAIVRELAEDRSHPTAHELFERLRPAFPTMSFATVYNTLDALAKLGLVGSLRLGSAVRYDPNTELHHHAVCDRCGAVIDLPTLDGPVKMRVPEGTQPGRVFRIRGRGIPQASGKNAPRGDHLVHIQVEIPTELTHRQRQLIEELARERGETGALPAGDQPKKGLMDRVRSLLEE